MENGDKNKTCSSSAKVVTPAPVDVPGGAAAGPGPLKKLKLDNSGVVSINMEITKLETTLCEHWSGGSDYAGEHASLYESPFLHVEIKDFIAEDPFLREMVMKMKGVELVEKSSDLFNFSQSQDLVSVAVPEVQRLREFFETKVLDFMNLVTGIPLNGQVDMFISEYVETDFLLCHDDELESRRIAFIFYLTEDWDKANGGSLDLFSSSDGVCPVSIVKSIIPAFNKFVFFNVTSKSFHQVGEVTKKVRRLAVSGWFYGDPLPRPTVSFPSIEYHSLQGNLFPTTQKLEDNFTSVYLSPMNYIEINASLEEYSIVKLKLLIQPEKYKSLLGLLEDKNLEWEERGPANVCSYQAHTRDILPIGGDGPGIHDAIKSLRNLFCSKPFYEFLEKITEFPIFAPNIQVTASLRKFQHKNYILLRPPEEKEPEMSGPTESSDEGETWEIAQEESDNEDPEGGETKVSSENQEPSSSSALLADQEESEDAEEEEEEEYGQGQGIEREIDIIYYLGDFNWNEEFGGQVIYTDATGQQLLTVTPEANAMLIVVREKGVTPYVSYVNYRSGKERFYAFSLTLSGFKD